MWSGEILFSELKKKNRWKVEFFSSDGTSKSASAHDTVPLGELFAERKEALDPQQYPDHVFNYMGLENVEQLTGDLVQFEPKHGKEVRSRSKVFRRGDILYGRLRPNLNKVLLVEDDIREGICSGEFYVLIPNQARILPHFARTILASKYVQNMVAGLITGSALPRLQLDDLLSIEVPLPPIDEQQEYEQVIIEETLRRRQLNAELAVAPQSLLDRVVAGLESGRRPFTREKPDGPPEQLTYDNPLPLEETSTRRKRASSGQAAFGFFSSQP